MKEFYRALGVILVVVTIVVLGIMAASTVAREKAVITSNALGFVVTPIQEVFSKATDAVVGFFTDIYRMNKIKEQLSQLEARNNQLEEQLRDIEVYKNENQRLRALLDMKERNQQFDMVGATVIARDPGNWYYTFTIDKGTNDGIAQKCVVLSAYGVIGHVYEVGSNWAKVMTIIDPGSSAGAFIPRTDDVGVVEGSLSMAQEGLCEMNYISKGSNIVVGDSVETSGLGGIYPRGLLIGKIKDIKSDPQGLSVSAVIEPATDFTKIREVLVIKDRY